MVGGTLFVRRFIAGAARDFHSKKRKGVFRGRHIDHVRRRDQPWHHGVGRNAVINFKGKKWENDAESQITDETNSGSGIDGVGGLIRFISEGTSQQLVGGYNAATKSGASFYNLQVLNGNDLHLLKGNTKVRNLLMLSNGRIFLHGNNFTVGHRHIGKIEGFMISDILLLRTRRETAH
jgi:hypothetical protein